MEKNIVNSVRRTDETYTFRTRKSGQHALAVLEKDLGVSDVWHARLAHVQHRTIKWIEDKDVIRDLDIRQGSVLEDVSLCIKGTTTKKLMSSRTHVKAGPAAAIQTTAAVMIVLLIIR